MVLYTGHLDVASRLSELKEWVKDHAGFGYVIVGISGGTDSTVVSKLLVDVLGKERVIGVLMPNSFQHDLDVAEGWCKTLGITYHKIDIFKVYKAISNALDEEISEPSNFKVCLNDCYKTNTPARIRMTILYGICAMYGGRVVNTCNLSEDWVGYSTKFGDSAGDFGPLANFTKTEVRELGRLLGVPEELVVKIPEDGMSGMSDEEKLGFTYEVLDKYIRTGEIEDDVTKQKIDSLHQANLHKITPMPTFKV